MHGNRESEHSCAPLAQMRMAHGKAVERGMTDALDAPGGRVARSGFAGQPRHLDHRIAHHGARRGQVNHETKGLQYRNGATRYLRRCNNCGWRNWSGDELFSGFNSPGREKLIAQLAMLAAGDGESTPAGRAAPRCAAIGTPTRDIRFRQARVSVPHAGVRGRTRRGGESRSGVHRPRRAPSAPGRGSGSSPSGTRPRAPWPHRSGRRRRRRA